MNKASDLWNNIKYTNVCVLGILEGKEREKKGQEKYLKK